MNINAFPCLALVWVEVIAGSVCTRWDAAGRGKRPLAVTPDAEGEWEEAGEEFGRGLPGDGQSNRKQRED